MCQFSVNKWSIDTLFCSLWYMKNIKSQGVKNKFNGYPSNVRTKLLAIRALILEVANKTEEVGILEECLKWNEPSYLTSESKSGSTIRIDWKAKDPKNYHLYFNCRTKLIEIFKELYPDDFDYIGNRCISFRLSDTIPKKKLFKCIEIALTYNSRNYKNFFK